MVTKPRRKGARLRPMDTQARGQAIRRRRLAHGIKSVRAFHEATGVSREAISAAEAGEATETTYSRLEMWLDKFEEETGAAEGDELGDELVEFSLSGDFGVNVVVKGPVSDMEQLEAAVARLLKQMRGDR